MKINLYLTKKDILVSSLISTVIFLVIFFNIPYSILCTKNNHLGYCGDIFKFFKILFLIAPPILLFSIINLTLPETIFIAWRKFTTKFSIVYILIILITPWYVGDEFFNIGKSVLAISLSVIYSIISIFLIIYKSIKKE